MKWAIFKHAALNALATFAYVTVVGLFMSNASRFFGPKDTALTPVAVIMLLVFSTALTGVLVFGQPVLWHLDGKKKDAIYLINYTLAVLLGLTMLTFIVLFLIGGRS